MASIEKWSMDNVNERIGNVGNIKQRPTTR